MTDDTATPTVPRAIVCPVEDCAVLIPDTVDDQRRHRRGHEHRVKVDDAIRRGLRNLTGRIDGIAGATKDDVREMHRLVEGIERLVKGIEIPEQQPQMEIARPTGWDDEVDDGDEDETAAAIDDDWASLTEPVAELITTTAADEDWERNQDRADAVAAFTQVQPAIDRDDEPGTYFSSARP